MESEIEYLLRYSIEGHLTPSKHHFLPRNQPAGAVSLGRLVLKVDIKICCGDYRMDVVF